MPLSLLNSTQSEACISTLISRLRGEPGNVVDVLLVGTTTTGLLDALANEAERPEGQLRLSVFEPLTDTHRTRTRQAIRYVSGIAASDL
ncbi:hypothetical protein [Burkholderia oklahomensis]|uniref:hypothetical protein n=1 Tax=Burkholderia oklahomensis TaxID=342113 RepID=UPI0005D7A663|nr:hypothetical protein [Burkholderia oklahomensis]AJX32752.1 hypothetical protein BG90_1032 [Burkholderia oklahomensis C6786]MBI0360165.1 hypothetical protein [Burkholderia oklahomensis]SUW59548.1 Uncharacterised protein [Burkholderia oklahomensis]